MTRDRAVACLLCACALAVLVVVPGCGPSAEDLAAVDYAPLERPDWDVATPAEAGLDPDALARLYYDASELETIYSLLVVKDGRLVAEDYFNGADVDQEYLLQSASKSYVSALVGIALREGYLESLDQKLLDFFPEYEDDVVDQRKREITLRQLLQMRSGYPWEETDERLWEAIIVGDTPPLIIGFPLTADPGQEFQYSNATSQWLATIVTRSSGMDLREFTQTYLAGPIGAEVGELWPDEYGGYYAFFHVTARDAARFGQLYLQDGQWEGEQVVPSEWVEDSLAVYSEDAWDERIGSNYDDIGYGYQWWSATAGAHRFDFAWGHGGQVIALVDDLDMVVVVTGDPFFRQHDGGSWKHERANLNLVADFIASLPGA